MVLLPDGVPVLQQGACIDKLGERAGAHEFDRAERTVPNERPDAGVMNLLHPLNQRRLNRGQVRN